MVSVSSIRYISTLNTLAIQRRDTSQARKTQGQKQETDKEAQDDLHLGRKKKRRSERKNEGEEGSIASPLAVANRGKPGQGQETGRPEGIRTSSDEEWSQMAARGGLKKSVS
jgi:hypothetical protein